MKKILLGLAFLCFFNFSFAESETYISEITSMGELGVSKKTSDMFDNGSDLNINFNLTTNEVAFQSYTFWNDKNIGLFTKLPIRFFDYHFSHSIPPKDGINTDIKSHMIGFSISPTIGLGFKKALSNNLIFLSAIGSGIDLGFEIRRVDSEKSNGFKDNRMGLRFNVLNNLDFKYLINDKFSIDIGLNTVLGFAEYKIQPKYDYSVTPIKKTIEKKWSSPFFELKTSVFLGVSYLIK